jgi:hypothetical protein
MSLGLGAGGVPYSAPLNKVLAGLKCEADYLMIELAPYYNNVQMKFFTKFEKSADIAGGHEK